MVIYLSGTINTAVFHDNGKYLFTGADDHKICILKAGSWSVEKTLMKHQGGVVDVSVHPSGKLALSVGKDRKLITWNLIKGRSAYVTNVKEEADFVRWSPEGTHYVVGFYKHADVYEVASAAVVYSIPLKGRANDLCFVDNDRLVLASDSPDLEIHSISEKTLLHKFPAHERRVRCLHLEKDPEIEDNFALVSASNDGLVKVWSLIAKKAAWEAEELLSHKVGCRITCMVVHRVPEIKVAEEKQGQKAADGQKSKKKKRKQVAIEPTTPESESDEEVSKPAGTKKKAKLVVEVENDVAKKSPVKNGKKKWNKKKNGVSS